MLPRKCKHCGNSSCVSPCPYCGGTGKLKTSKIPKEDIEKLAKYMKNKANNLKKKKNE
jgi:nitrate reductase beta subunit